MDEGLLCEDVIKEIIDYLNVNELGICLKISKTFREIALQKKYWKPHISKFVNFFSPFYIYKLENGSNKEKLKIKYQLKFKTKQWEILTKKQKEKILRKECHPMEHSMVPFGSYMFLECNWKIKHDYFDSGVTLEVDRWCINSICKDVCVKHVYRLQNWELTKVSTHERSTLSRNYKMYFFLILSIPVVICLEIFWFVLEKCKKYKIKK
jgi:hypothetical protein